MGNCMSTKAIAAEQHPSAPHPQARRVWLVATPIDSREIPLDLVGIDSDGLKAAMRNRGLEIEHWALKVDPLASTKSEPSIFDITVQRGALISQLHSTSSPYWKAITRRVAVGWTLWTDDEILHATNLLIQARPKYDARSNNSQQLARLLGRHVELVVPSQVEAGHGTTASETPAQTMPSAAGSSSILKENRSQRTLVPSQRSQSIEDDEGNKDEKVSMASMRDSHRLSMSRPPLIHLSSAPTAGASEMAAMVRPVLQRSAETEASATAGSVRARASTQPRFSQQVQMGSSSSPLNPTRGMHRQSASEVRARTSSDAAYATIGDPRSSTLNARVARRRSEAPSDWLADPAHQSSSVRSRSTARNVHRDSVMSLGAGSMVGSPSMAWPAAQPSMVGLPSMPSMHLPPMAMGPMMPMLPQSGSIMFNPAAAGLQVPYFAPPQSFHGMPLLAPPSPGFHSKASSGVPTPPESPHGSTVHLPKHEFYAFQPQHV